MTVALRESSVAAQSTTTLDDRLAVCVAIANHRTDMCDIDALLSAVLNSARETALLKVES